MYEDPIEQERSSLLISLKLWDQPLLFIAHSFGGIVLMRVDINCSFLPGLSLIADNAGIC